MIRQNDKIMNTRTGQIMIFRKTGADTKEELLEIECFNPKSNEREPLHIHPKQESYCEVISGRLHFLIDGKEIILEPGEHLTIASGIPHCFWNEDEDEAHHIQRFVPALNIAGFFDTFFALSRDGKLNKNGIPNLFHASIIILAHKDEIRLANPPWALQYLAYSVLAAIGKLMGYCAEYHTKT